VSDASAKPPSSAVTDQILLRLREAAQLLAISERSVWSLVARGALPAVRFSARCVRLQRADVEAFAAKHASTARTTVPLLPERRMKS